MGRRKKEPEGTQIVDFLVLKSMKKSIRFTSHFHWEKSMWTLKKKGVFR